MDEYYALFGSVNRAMKAEKALAEAGIDFTIMPSPRTIPSPCGLALKIKKEDIESAEHILDIKRLGIKHLYLRRDNEYDKLY